MAIVHHEDGTHAPSGKLQFINCQLEKIQIRAITQMTETCCSWFDQELIQTRLETSALQLQRKNLANDKMTA
jgi:hypothetical protein